ncbi:MAG: bifunctional phosphoribosylaminoimidazolecarboxamide formyltransferase/IMP cyclohydrolase [Candidatus Veblenbacteria bacterium]|nr:bifunctional phosphoribosylaminoimidazolecarboxamide formyltransferase/IMP cyclohydrolase [Candidatus Veblenbacteria bacterium]
MPIALLSVYDKTGIVEFAAQLVKLGWSIVSSGGTHASLVAAGIPARKVEEVTGFPEIMDSRVKTLHPKIHGGILADRDVPQHLEQAKELGIGLIDMVVVNLYPFAQAIAKPGATQDDAIHNVDIGGPAMLRAAAKNFRHVTVIADPADYQAVLQELKQGGVALGTRQRLAVKVFSATSQYDALIANYFSDGGMLQLTYRKQQNLRYGENPHQAAVLYSAGTADTSVVNAEVLHGKELSYNNLVDGDAALSLIREFNAPAAAVIKHTNPCGCATAPTIEEAFNKAYAADTQSAFGGIIVLNRPCTLPIAEEISKVFAELVLAPDFTAEALTVLTQKKNLRLLRLGDMKSLQEKKAYRSLVGGLLEQDLDVVPITSESLTVVTKRAPSPEELKDMLFAFAVCRHVKSNAIVVAKGGVAVGVGAGQMSRVESVEIAVKKAGGQVRGAVAASDGFFPFPDGVEALAKAGVTAIVHPGGSLKDEEVTKVADELGLAMVFTGVRVFRH